ncbi:MAG TPA: hypothetical protein VE964_12820 [Myxococcales bacterium]|nr:hypothetical protein [Myxococcales bacterium]
MEMTNYLRYGEGQWVRGTGNPIYQEAAAPKSPLQMQVIGLVPQVLPTGEVVIVRTFLTPV